MIRRFGGLREAERQQQAKALRDFVAEQRSQPSHPSGKPRTKSQKRRLREKEGGL